MSAMKKCLMLTGAGVLGIVSVVLLVKSTQCRHHSGLCEKVGKGFDERLHESKEALDKASSHVQSILESIKNKN